MGKRLAVFLNSFLLLQSFWGLTCNKRFLKKKKVLRVVFYKIEVKMVTNWSVLLEKHQTIECLRLIDFFTHF